MNNSRENIPEVKETYKESDTKDISLLNTSGVEHVINPLLWLNKESQKKEQLSETEKLERRILSTFFMENKDKIFKPDEIYEVIIENKKYKFKLTNFIIERSSSEPSKGKRFEILNDMPIGKGSFGEVFKTLGYLIPNPNHYLDLRIDKPRVVKVISYKTSFFENQEEFETFVKDEALFASSVNHLRVKQPVFTKMNGNDIALFIMRYIKADSLENLFFDPNNIVQLLAGNEPTRDKIFAGFIKFCIRALRALQDQVHDNNRIHRDIKPANSLITRNIQTGEYEIYFIDFGISKVKNSPDEIKLTKLKDSKIGTSGYIAPELLSASIEDISSKSISNEKSDLYSLSILLREVADKIGISISKSGSQDEPKKFTTQEKFLSSEDNKLNGVFLRMEELDSSKRLSVEESLDIFEDIDLDLKLKTYQVEKNNCDGITAANKSARIARNELRILFNSPESSLEDIKGKVIKKVIAALEKFPNELEARKEFLNILDIKAFQDPSFIQNPAKFIDDIYSTFSKNLNDLTHLLGKAGYMKQFYSDNNDRGKTNDLEKIIKDINIILNKRRHYKLGVDDIITLNQYLKCALEQYQPTLDDIELRYTLTKVIVDFQKDHKLSTEEEANIKTFQEIIDNKTTSEALQNMIKIKCEKKQIHFYGSELEKRLLQAMNIFMKNKTQILGLDNFKSEASFVSSQSNILHSYKKSNK